VFDPRCVKCRDAQGQYFTYDFGDGHIWHFDVQRAAAVALAHPETLGLVVVTDLLEHTSRNEVDSNLRFFRDPRRWPAWPFLPLVRRCPGRAEELGLLFDAVGAVGLYGLSATVFKSNLFRLPQKLDEFLTLPHETFDTAEEVAEGGWTID